MHRVIVWGTGFVGTAVLKSLLGHPAFEVAGVVVHDPAKDGLDVGEIVGGPRTGTSRHGSDEALAEQLWNQSTELTKSYLD